jgi:hypothetical protein
MPRANNHNDEKQRQPTWSDISLLLQQLEAEYGCHVEVSIDVEGTRGASGALWVYARAYEGWKTVEAPRDVVRSLWPTHQHATMPGLMFRLLYQLGHCIDARLKQESAT